MLKVMGPMRIVIPRVRVVDVRPPIMVTTDLTNFQRVVQNLTGKRKSHDIDDGAPENNVINTSNDTSQDGENEEDSFDGHANQHHVMNDESKNIVLQQGGGGGEDGDDSSKMGVLFTCTKGSNMAKYSHDEGIKNYDSEKRCGGDGSASMNYSSDASNVSMLTCSTHEDIMFSHDPDHYTNLAPVFNSIKHHEEVTSTYNSITRNDIDTIHHIIDHPNIGAKYNYTYIDTQHDYVSPTKRAKLINHGADGHQYNDAIIDDIVPLIEHHDSNVDDISDRLQYCPDLHTDADDLDINSCEDQYLYSYDHPHLQDNYHTPGVSMFSELLLTTYNIPNNIIDELQQQSIDAIHDIDDDGFAISSCHSAASSDSNSSILNIMNLCSHPSLGPDHHADIPIIFGDHNSYGELNHTLDKLPFLF